MFRELKKWGDHLLKRMRRQNSSLRIRQICDDDLNDDPRELPRPTRDSPIYFGIPDNENIPDNEKAQIKTTTNYCNCSNCQILCKEYGECSVCTEPLQPSTITNRGISTCATCNNVCCVKCIEKLTTCPFCRTPLIFKVLPTIFSDRIHNVPLERLIAKLKLPCRNARFGCTQFLSTENRSEHEAKCAFSPSGCPLVKYCGWQGDGYEIIHHLRNHHNITVVPANGIDMEIGDFRAKLKAAYQRSRRYCISLICYANIYICKVHIHKNKLIICFQQLECNIFKNFNVNKPSDHKYLAWIEIRSTCKTFKSILPIEKKINLLKKLEIPCEVLLSSNGRDSDMVKISITIKQQQLSVV